MSAPLLIQGLTKIYKSHTGKGIIALRDLNLEIEEGEIFGFLGPNGAGKTTTLNILLGFIFPTRGKAWIMGEPIGSLNVRRRLGYLSEVHRSFEYLTPEEALFFYGRLFGLTYYQLRRRIDELLDLVGLAPHRKKRIGSFSKGMLQRMGLAESLINDPQLLLLDEPTSGLDPIGRREFREFLLKLRDAGKTIFLCSHLLSEVELICNRVGILHSGVLLRVGELDELLAQKGVQVVARNVPEALIEKFSSTNKVERKNGEVHIDFPTHQDSQRALAELTGAGAEIIFIKPLRETLEDLFIRILEEEGQNAGAADSH